MLRTISLLLLLPWAGRAQDALPPPPSPLYETRAVHDPNGIGKFYLGREIAHVMGPGGIPWLERAEREDEEHPSRLIGALELKGDEVVADFGAGSGYFTFRLAPKVPRGRVLAVDVQERMIDALKRRVSAEAARNVEVVHATEEDPKLPDAGVDLILMVDVYHELAFPYETMKRLRKSLRPGGRLVLVEYRKEDPKVPIKEVHKMSEAQMKREMEAVGMEHVKTVGILPRQHIGIFTPKR
jgi:ubiquinone/menaquinone biosynthesis C-methylase UbiE